MTIKDSLEKCKREYKKVTDDMHRLAEEMDALDPVTDASDIRRYSKIYSMLDAKADGMLLIMNAFGYTMSEMDDGVVAWQIDD